MIPPGWSHEKDVFVSGAAKFGLVVIESDDLLVITVADRHAVVTYALNDVTPVRVVGKLGSGPLEFHRPMGAHYLTTSKTLLICDQGNNRLQEIALDGGFVREIAVESPWQVVSRLDLGMLFVASGSCVNVALYPSGEILYSIGRSFGGCTSLALALDRSLICANKDAIVAMTTDGVVTSRYDCHELSTCPKDVAVLPNGEVVATDGDKGKLFVFGSEGRVVKECGTKGPVEPGHFQAPSALFVCGRRLFVLDAGSVRLQVFGV